MGEQRVTSRTYGLSYSCALPALTQVAREHGYALAVHGSMATDLDLIACPWVDEASDPDVLAEAIKVCVGGMFAEGKPSAAEAVTLMPHGRRSYTILPSDLFLGVPRLPFTPWIDLSIAPSTQ